MVFLCNELVQESELLLALCPWDAVSARRKWMSMKGHLTVGTTSLTVLLATSLRISSNRFLCHLVGRVATSTSSST